MAKKRAPETEQSPGLRRGVWVHTRKTACETWVSAGLCLLFARVPVVGELFRYGPDDASPFYKVEYVVHCLDQHADSEAEVYAIETTDPVTNRM